MANEQCIISDSVSPRFRYQKTMAAKGYYLSKSRIIILVTTVVVLLVAEGLIIGLVARPDCSYEAVVTTAPKTTTTLSSGQTTEGSTEPMGPWSNIRLPDNLIPTKYEIDLRPILSPNAEDIYLFHGSSSVTYTCEKATKYVIMHSNKLNYTKDQVSVKVGDSDFTVTDVMFYQPNEFVVVETDQPCSERQTYTLTVTDFVSELSNDLNGLYRSEYYTADGTHKVIATSQMAVTGARETFPCFDEPALKANFTVRLWYRSNTGEFALSNMPPESYTSKVIQSEMWNSTLFQETVPMSTYLLALMVTEFNYKETFSSNKNIQIRIYARKEAVDNKEAEYAAEITPKILDFYENYFNVPYPLPKSDQVAIPDFGAGAMENWGLVIYRETILLYNDAVSSIFNKQTCTSVVAHELAHMWFGNLVSPAWWDDIWLNEGFATYVSFLGEAEAQPTWKSMERFLSSELHVAMEVDGLTSSHPLVQPVNLPNEILAQFDYISYDKGASILRMINGFMGEKNFVDGLTAYLNDFAYTAATHGDLFKYWEIQANSAGLDFPTSLVTILETWTLQMGYPVINLQKQTGTNIYRISQDYFLFDNNATLVQTPGSLTYGYQWYVPLTYKTFSQIGSGETTQMWLEPDKEPASITESEYLLANIDAVGFYRVNYDVSTWTKLTAKLKSSSFRDISASNRAQLIDDAFNLVRPGLLDITIGLEMSKYLLNEDDYIPWRTFMDRAKFIEYLIGRSDIYGTFSNFILQLVEPTLYYKYGWEERNTSDAAQVERKTMQLGIEGACYYGSQDCVANATGLYKDWMNNPSDTSIISNTYRDDVYCAAIRNGGVKEWNFAWEQHRASSNAQEQSSLRYGMSCSKEPWILTRFMQYCVDGNHIRRQDGLSTCLQYISEQEYGRDLAWAFIVDNWDSLVEQYGSGISFERIIDVITRRFSTEYDLQRLKDFKSSNSNLGTAERAVDQAIERTKVNIRWRELNEETLKTWLLANTNHVVRR